MQTAAVDVQMRIVGVKMTNGGGDRVSVSGSAAAAVSDMIL